MKRFDFLKNSLLDVACADILGCQNVGHMTTVRQMNLLKEFWEGFDEYD